jgi:hypothetical protein
VNQNKLIVFQENQPDILEEQSIQELTPPQEEHINVESASQNLHNVDEIVGLRRSSKVRRPSIFGDYYVYLLESNFDVGPKDDPISFSHPMSDENSKFWYNAMIEEIESMTKNQVWEIVELSKGVKAIGCKWIYKTKKDSNGNIN